MKFLYLLLSLCLAIPFSINAQNDPGQTTGDTGTVTFIYQGTPVTYTTVRSADGEIWLQQNLGASQIANSASDPASYGHYFQWGRWDDGHQLPNSNTDSASFYYPSNPSVVSAGNPNFLIGVNAYCWWPLGDSTDTWSNNPPSVNNGMDPCAAISPGWHLPSSPEINNMAVLENISDSGSAFASSLRLPVAGYRSPIDGDIVTQGIWGSYFSSSPLYGPVAEGMTIFPDTLYLDDIDMGRYYGYSLRCMTSCTGVFAPTTITGPDTICAGSIVTYTSSIVYNTDSYSWVFPTGWTIIGPSNGQAVTVQTGTISGQISVKAVNSCMTSDSVAITVSINPLPSPVIVASGNILSTGTYTSYQWLHEDTIITGATNPTYMALDSGTYKVIATDSNGCSDTSGVYIHAVGIKFVSGDPSIRIYPNPAGSTINIESSVVVDAGIYSIDGTLILLQQNAVTLDVSHLATGTYQLKLSDEKGRLLKVEKLLIIQR